jgi:glycine/D-amino acid oxidase-like deaminating enzyme
MRHDAHGWWIREAGAPVPAPPLHGDERADVVVIGAGYTGLWATWELLAAGASVVVLEAARAGFGPSGRNGGFVESLAYSGPALAKLHGIERGRAVVEASMEAVRGIGDWCAAEAVDAWYRPGSQLVLSCAPGQDGIGAGAIDGAEVVAISGEEARARCGSPLFRGGVEVRTGATVQPARLAFGLRAKAIERGARLYEHARVRALRVRADGVQAETAHGRVLARTAVVAVNAASGALKPLRDCLTVGSSHIVVTEPVPDVLDALGWRGGEAITDARALLHYFRTTRDDRIVFGWAGGRMAAGARTGGRVEVDPRVAGQVAADLVRFFPALAGRRIEHAWGGPIDVSPTHLPQIVSLAGGRAWTAFGYTGNGVGPSRLCGRTLASLVLDRRDDLTRLALVDPPPRRVPPEPLRSAGAAILRAALVRAERAQEHGGRADPLTRALAGLPARLGVRIVR